MTMSDENGNIDITVVKINGQWKIGESGFGATNTIKPSSIEVIGDVYGLARNYRHYKRIKLKIQSIFYLF